MQGMLGKTSLFEPGVKYRPTRGLTKNQVRASRFDGTFEPIEMLDCDGQFAIGINSLARTEDPAELWFDGILRCVISGPDLPSMEQFNIFGIIRTLDASIMFQLQAR